VGGGSLPVEVSGVLVGLTGRIVPPSQPCLSAVRHPE
jgi:hypothetical protein